jgi:hypothetical protein
MAVVVKYLPCHTGDNMREMRQLCRGVSDRSDRRGRHGGD